MLFASQEKSDSSSLPAGKRKKMTFKRCIELLERRYNQDDSTIATYDLEEEDENIYSERKNVNEPIIPLSFQP